MCLMKNGCEWKPLSFECGQLNCEKIFGWQNCAKSAGCAYTADDRKCNDQSEAGAFAGFQFGPQMQVQGFTPQAFKQPNMFRLPNYNNPINGDSMDGYYGGYEPEGQFEMGEWEHPLESFDMEELFKNPYQYQFMKNFFNKYMDTKFQMCTSLSDETQCGVEQACEWDTATNGCTKKSFTVSPEQNSGMGGGMPGYGMMGGMPFLSASQPQAEQPAPSEKSPSVVFQVSLGVVGVVLGFLSSVGLQHLCCEKRRDVDLDQYLRQNV